MMSSWGGGGESVDGGFGEHGVGHDGEPFIGSTVGRDDGGAALVAGDDQFVEVGGGGRVQRLQRKIIDDEQTDLCRAAHPGFGAVVESRCP